MSQLRSSVEERIVAAVHESRDQIVDLTGQLIACDTTARLVGEAPRDEEKLQVLLQRRLAALGAVTDLWEPEPTGTGNRHVPDGLDFRGRPQLAAWLRGVSGNGPSLLLNGHIDAVSADPVEDWSTDPFAASMRDGCIYGRGANDMKGGLAALVVALEVLHRLDVRLHGDVVFCSVTDEESSGAGGFAAVAHGIRADAGICAEPTGLEVWTACRGTVCPTITVRGRAGHAEMRQPHWSEGGAVNAVEKMMVVLEAARALREEWRSRPDHRHPLLSPGDIVPTVIKGGTWVVTYPSSCSVRFDCQYLPGHVDADGTGWAVQREIVDWMERAAAADPWFEAHPLEWAWSSDVVAAEMDPEHPLVAITIEAAKDVGREASVAGFDSWHDAATFTRHGHTPTFSFGPSDCNSIHGIDERVRIDDLVDVTATVALSIVRYCGAA